jgi:hypothetical protein
VLTCAAVPAKFERYNIKPGGEGFDPGRGREIHLSVEERRRLLRNDLPLQVKERADVAAAIARARLQYDEIFGRRFSCNVVHDQGNVRTTEKQCGDLL